MTLYCLNFGFDRRMTAPAKSAHDRIIA